LTTRNRRLANSLSTLCLALAACGSEGDAGVSVAAGMDGPGVPSGSGGGPAGPVAPEGASPDSPAIEAGPVSGGEPGASEAESAMDGIELVSGEPGAQSPAGGGAPAEGTSEPEEGSEGEAAGTGEAEGPAPELHVYLALGQSNMQGAGHLPEEAIFHPRVMSLQSQNCAEHDIPYGQWREQFQPMMRCQEGTRPKADGTIAPIGLSPVDTFAVTMAEASEPNVTIGIVGAAYGGTDIQAHLPNCGQFCVPPFGDVNGAPIVNGTTPIYQWILDLARTAQETGVIKGIIFHHGENNSQDPQWLTHVNTLVTSLRNDLGLSAAEVPFIAGELPRTGCCAAHNQLVQQIPNVVENGHFVSSGPREDGSVLVDRGDGLHWSTESVLEMGRRYAAKMLEVRGN
jgi:hypothetical protein